MKRILFAALLAVAAVPASAASVGFSIGFHQPGLQGDVHVGDFYRPYWGHARPVVVYPAPVYYYGHPYAYQPPYRYRDRPRYRRDHQYCQDDHDHGSGDDHDDRGHWKRRH